MSVARDAALRVFVGAGAAVLAVAAVGATAAQAAGRDAGSAARVGYEPTPAAGKNGADFCRFSPDGSTWLSAAGFRTGALMPGSDGTVHLAVRGAGGHACTVSLTSYGAQGPTWQTSGKQVFQDFETVIVTDRATGTLVITVPGPGCFAQIDLSVGTTRHDGRSADLPEGPTHPVFGNDLIAAWHGGTQTCEATPPATTAPATTPPAATPPASASVPVPPASASPATTPPATGVAPSATASVTVPPAGSPSYSAAAAPSPSDSVGGSLAHTGSSTAVSVAAGAAAVLLAAGGGLFVAARRRRTAGGH